MNNSKEDNAILSHHPQETSTAQSAASNSGNGNYMRESDNPQRVRTPATLGSAQIRNSGTSNMSHPQNINQQLHSAAASYGAILDQLSPEFIVSLKQGMSAVFGNDQDTSIGTIPASVNGSSTPGNAATAASGTTNANASTNIQQQQQQSNMFHAVHPNPTQTLGQHHPASSMNVAATSHSSTHRQQQPSTENVAPLQSHNVMNAAASISSPWVVSQANEGTNSIHANTASHATNSASNANALQPSHVSVPSVNTVAQHILPNPTTIPLTHSNLLQQQQQQQQQQNLSHTNTALMQFLQPNVPNNAVNNLFNTLHQAFQTNNTTNTIANASAGNSSNNIAQQNVSSTTVSASTNNHNSHPTHVVQPTSNATIQTNLSGLFNGQPHVNTIHSTAPLQQMLNITLPNIQSIQGSIQGNTIMGWNVQPAQLQPTQPVQQSQFPSLMLPTQTAQKRKANEMSSSNKPQEEEYSNTAVSASSSSAGNSGGSKSRRSGNTPKPAKLPKTTQQVQQHVAGQQISSQHQAQQPPFAVSVTDSTGHFRQATETPPNNTIEDVTLGRGNVNTSANASPSNVPLSMQANSNEEKKRQEKNIREQKRSQQISQQIKELRQVLTESKVPFQKNKYSILMSVVDYIKNLQDRANFLDSEHGKLIHTIQQTSEFVNNGMIHHQDEENANVGNDAELLYVQGLDYKAIFEQCVFPIAVAALDGRFLTFNQQFGALAGLNQESTESLSLFGLLQYEDADEVFRALGSLLKDSDSEGSRTSGNHSNSQQGTSPDPSSADDGNNGNSSSEDKQSDNSDEKNGESGSGSNVSGLGDSGDDVDSGFTYSNGYWSGDLSGTNQHLRMHISLSRTADGTPKFFNCSLARSVQEYEDSD